MLSNFILKTFIIFSQYNDISASSYCNWKHASVKNVLPGAHLKSVSLSIKSRIPARQCQWSRAEITALFIVLSDTQ